jgi:hypothetical protein
MLNADTECSDQFIFFLLFRVGVMEMRKMMHLVGLHGLEDIVGSGIQTTMVSVHMIFIPEISEAKVQYLFLFLSYKIFQLLFSIHRNLD